MLASAEPELAIRDGAAYGRRLVRPASRLVPPGGGQPWRLDATRRGTLDGLALMTCPRADAPLEPGHVRVAVRAAGLNFRDVLISLDMYGGDAVMGVELAGVVLETGPDVPGLAAGDRVLGLAEGGFGPVAVADGRQLVPVPAGWSSRPRRRCRSRSPRPGTRWPTWPVLRREEATRALGCGRGGNGPVVIGQYLGLEVFGTASPGKHGVLIALGLSPDHIASSRSAEFGGGSWR